jgi:hypothetical protein
MPRHIDVELTSRTEASWTWRAAGARQPKGSVAAELVPAGASVGSVLRAEVTSGIDGIEVVALTPKQERREPEVERITVLGSPRGRPDVSVSLAREPRGERPDRDRSRSGGHRGRPDQDRRDGPARSRRPAAADAGRHHAGTDGSGAGEADDSRKGDRRSARPRAATGPGDPGRRPGPARRDRRLTVPMTHRNDLLAHLGPEQLPIAEQLLRGGLPAVRQAVEEQNAAARAAGRPTVNADPFLAIAEELLPAVNLATWKDRASATQAAGKDVRLREMRAVVAASRTVSLDEEGRAMAKQLHEALDQRAGALRDEWLARLTNALDEGRVLDALRIVARPPEPGTRCTAELAVRLSEAAGAALATDVPAEEWRALLDAVVDSPVRRTVHPAGIPADAEAQQAARAAAGLVPHLAKLLGLRVPPPPPRRPITPRPLSRTGG